MRRRVFACLAIGLTIGLIGYLCLFYNPIRVPSKAQLERAIKDGLLIECSNYSWSAVNDNWYHLEKHSLPKSIRELNPRTLFVTDDAVLISFWLNYKNWARELIDSKFITGITLYVYRDHSPHDFEMLTDVVATLHDGMYLEYPKRLEPAIRSRSDIPEGAALSGGNRMQERAQSSSLKK